MFATGHILCNIHNLNHILNLSVLVYSKCFVHIYFLMVCRSVRFIYLIWFFSNPEGIYVWIIPQIEMPECDGGLYLRLKKSIQFILFVHFLFPALSPPILPPPQPTIHPGRLIYLLLCKQPPTHSSLLLYFLLTHSLGIFLIWVLNLSHEEIQIKQMLSPWEICAIQWCIVLGQIKVSVVWSLHRNYK